MAKIRLCRVYGWVTFRGNVGLGKIELGRWIDVSHRVGRLMSYCILPLSGIPISCTTVQRLTKLEKKTDEWKSKMEQYDQEITNKMENVKSSIIPESTFSDIPKQYVLDLEKEDEKFYEQFNKAIDDP